MIDALATWFGSTDFSLWSFCQPAAGSLALAEINAPSKP